jgi:PEP-CTERM motif
MSRPGILAGIVTAAFCLTLAASVRADNAQVDIELEKLMFAERHDLTAVNEQIDTNYLYTAHFENNNGKHLGFSMALAHNGPKPEIVRPLLPATASQNPEPTAMVLLGTGLAAGAAFARKHNRRRKY